MTSRSNSTLTLRVFLLSFLLVSIAGAQRPPRGTNSLRIQYLVFERPSQSQDTTLVDFLYRIPGSQFVFLRDQAAGGFVARGELFVEFRNDDGSRIIRDFATINIRRQQQVRDQETVDDYQGMIQFRVPAGEYRAIIEAKDMETDRSFLDRSRRFTFGLEAKGTGVLANVLLGYAKDSSETFIPFNRGPSVRFGSRGGVLLSVRDSTESDSVSISWQLTQTTGDGDITLVPLDSTVHLATGTAYVSLNSTLPLAYGLQSAGERGWTTAYLNLPFERLEPGLYELTLSVPDEESSSIRTVTIPVIWEKKPQSLSRFDLAVDAMRYVATEEDIDDMVGFLADGGRERFREFWVRKDPDPTTAYNEVLAEYYRRVDETILRFSTQGELDGYRSDRGRIYILFGAPTSMNRIFRPETGPREIWEYQMQRKRFIFTDPTRTGEYMLSQTEDL